MTVHTGLLASVIDHPDDDCPRLVYADFLDEQGSEANAARAEFIRLQIERARFPKNDPRQAEWLTREKALSDRWAWEWAVPLHGHISEWVLRRGFIEKVASGLECSADEIRATLRLAPIRYVRDQSQLTRLPLPEQAASILLNVRRYLGSPAEGFATTLSAGEDFHPHSQRGSDILARFTGPPYPGEPEGLYQDKNNPLDPWSAPLFMQARLVAAVARAAAQAGSPIPLVLGPGHHRVW
jgi:uncharacterized protein (TIGR02996 family)